MEAFSQFGEVLQSEVPVLREWLNHCPGNQALSSEDVARNLFLGAPCETLKLITWQFLTVLGGQFKDVVSNFMEDGEALSNHTVLFVDPDVSLFAPFKSVTRFTIGELHARNLKAQMKSKRLYINRCCTDASFL
ncbi:hypothetical protein ALP22_00822 [Pseudomonas coronafaciens pv. porri]|nr:hypothetical protein ALP22_00822 [Pseudomonas coronafaciens pv. porri]